MSLYFPNAGAEFRVNGFVVLSEAVPSAIRDDLLAEILDCYNPGHTEEQRNEVAYRTACLPMVERARQQWVSGDRHSLPLNRLAHVMLDTATELLEASRLDCGDVQIAVREPDHNSPGPHIDGYSATEERPNTPRAIVGVYLTDVATLDDGALMIWPEKRGEIAASRGEELYTDARSIAEGCTADNPNDVVLGGAGTMFIVDGNVPHANAARINKGQRVALYLRVY
jgi:hypothetical protein